MTPWAVFLGASTAYIGFTLACFDAFGPVLLSLAIVPITAAAWFWNERGGLGAALLFGYGVNTLILFYQGSRGWDALFNIHGGFGLALLILLGTLIGYFSTLRKRLLVELQKQNETESALVQSREKYRRIVEGLRNEYFFYSHDTHGVFHYLSPSVTNVLGYPVLDFLKHYTTYLTDHPINLHVKEYTNKSIQGIRQPPYEVQIYHQNGEERWLEVSEIPILDGAGKVTAVEGLAHDITNRKQITAALEVRNREILEFTHNVTHDLKKPLTTIKTLFSLLEHSEGGRDDPAFRDIRAAGKEAVAYMEELLDDLLTCARLEYAGLELTPEAVRVDKIARLALERFKFQIEAKKIQVTVDAPFQVWVDQKSFTKILMNLVANAVNYIGENHDPEIVIRGIVKSDEVEISIRDTGMGIPEADKNRIFKKFVRGTNTLAVTGTGLGLPIVKSAVEAHGGRIWFESVKGLGTTFFFTIPIHRDIPGSPVSERR